MSGLPEIEGVTDLAEIGRGGFGVVYLGNETEFSREVAVKVLLPSLDERTRRRFERERRAMGSVSGHPNIVTVYRGGLTPTDQPYLVMEYLAGGSLSDHLQKSGPFDWRLAAQTGAKLADALGVAHKAGILHRDVKPGNIFMTESGEPKLGDFGIARLDDGQDSRTGSITASIAHAPPEIVDGHRGDERSDLYSLASTIYAMTVGAAPFSRNPDQGVAALLARIANDEPPGLHLEDSARDFEATLLKALSKRPEDRHDTITEFGTALRRAALAPTAAEQRAAAQTHRPPPPSQPLAPAAVVHSGAPAAAPSVATPTPAPKRATSPSQMGFIALLALAIAGFGGWAAARAVLNSDDADVTQRTTVIATAEPVEPTAVPATPIPATAVPATSVPATAVPATPVPTAAPTSTPQPGVDSGRGTNLGSATEGFTRVSDFSGAITVDVPDEWARIVEDGSAFDLAQEGLTTVRVFSAGGTLENLSSDVTERDLSSSGLYVFAARIGEGITTAGVLEVGLDAFLPTCIQGEVESLQLIDGEAEYQLLECTDSAGNDAGVVVIALVPDDDPEVGVSLSLQLSDIGEVDVLVPILLSLNIDSSQIPTA